MTRVGVGYDIHRLASGRRLILGGVAIPSPVGLAGHSDADVVVHAVMDALLGAAGLPDIGQQFPNTDPRYRDIASLTLLDRVGTLIAEQGYRVGNVDVTLIAEAPPIGPYVAAMRETMAKTLAVLPAAIGVKATTHEGIGGLGRGEGMAAFAVALLT